MVQTQDSAEMKLQIEKLLQLAAIEPVSSPMEPGFFSRIFLVPKSSGGYRPVIDLSALNLYLDVPKFKMETIHSIIPALEESQWAITVDLQNAYFHVPIHKDARKFLRFAVRDQVFQFRALPFGLATAPFVFSWFLRPFVKFLRASGIKIHTYLDDWIVHHRDHNTLLSHKDYVLQWAEQLGLQVNFQKSSLVPVQTVVFLGARLDLQSHLAFPSPEHLNRVKVCIGQILQGKLMSARHWSQLIGLLNFIASFIPFGRLALRPLQMHLSNHWDFDWTQEHNTTNVKKATSAPTTDLVSSTKMDSGRVPSPGNAIPGSEPDGHTFHGRQSLGLGGSFSRVSCVRTLGHSGSAASYKSIRNESSVSCHLSTQLCVAASGDNNCHRQYNSPVLSEASGGHSQPISLVLDSEGFPNLPGDRSGISKQTHSRSSEFTSRSTFTTQPGCSLGVVVEPKCIGPSLVHLGPPTDRRFCYSIQQPSSKVLLSTSGPVLRGSGCFKSEVGSTIPLFVSSIQPNPGGTSETTSVSKLQVHSGVSSETRSSVVSINARSIPRKRRHSVSATISSGPAVSTPELYVTPKRAGPKSSRCAAITKGLEKRGLHPSIQEFILKDTVNSTCQVYDAKWSVFEAWCQSHQPPLNPLVLSVSQVGQFYVHLFKDRNLSLSAILGYRSALNSVFKTHNLRKLAQDPIFTRLFQGFKRTRMSSPRSLKPPGWNLALVLHCLSASPFEPLGSIPIKFLAWKTAFLTRFPNPIGYRLPPVGAACSGFSRCRARQEMVLG